ncbi:hypothetical protein BUALT_Bualt01G0080500 [Buddleja alternifolia]|uniref:Uncharacterized protein n=1 Tax=Buddleja alternifolia TaxID=168488 RepID=A0AAV6Y5E2_9LAMI|nr:hypothetical protein BUALT_Bualt01G0080500 [Buddleja alternifolia]
MASNLYRRFSSTIARSEFSNSVSRRRSIGTTVELFQSQQPEKKDSPPISDDKEKIRNQIEGEQKYDSKAEENGGGGDEFVNRKTGEVGGPRGPEPTSQNNSLDSDSPPQRVDMRHNTGTKNLGRSCILAFHNHFQKDLSPNRADVNRDS